jgi:predicted GNAT family acetyltransferase
MHPLDNVIWHALTTRQAQLGERRRSAGKFHNDVSLLGALAELGRDGYAALAEIMTTGDRVGLLLDEAEEAPGFQIASASPVVQMVRDSADVPSAAADPPVAVALTASDVPDMMALAELTQPGPFNRRTREMGEYFGIRHDRTLVAMAGERLRVPGHTEISAICTHPDHLRRGHAGALTALLIGRVLDRGERPFLHVRPENTRAVALYERLGFERRTARQYVVLRKLA